MRPVGNLEVLVVHPRHEALVERDPIESPCVLDIVVDEAGVDRLLIAFEIAGMFFAERRILIQEAAGICYSKLKDLLGRELHASARFVLTEDDISQYKQIPHPARHRAAKLHVAS